MNDNEEEVCGQCVTVLGCDICPFLEGHAALGSSIASVEALRAQGYE
jgi:hypothetical protein